MPLSTISLGEALCYFSGGFAGWVEDPAELERQLHEHRMESEEILEAIRVIGAYAALKVAARRKAPAAMRTLAASTALEWLVNVGGRASYAELREVVRRRHRYGGIRCLRVLDELVRAGVLRVVDVHGSKVVELVDEQEPARELEPLRDSSAYEHGRRDREQRRPRLSAESFAARFSADYMLAPYSYSYYVRGYDNYRPALRRGLS